ncbi:MAG: hypothetical protein AAF483_01565 [Planctomycetota bacterium]
MRSLDFTLGLICLVSVPLLARGAPPTEQNQESQSSSRDEQANLYTSLVQQLGNTEFAKRKEAFLELWKAGPKAIAAVESGLGSKNLQIAQGSEILLPILKLDGLGPSSELYSLVIEPTPAKISTLCSNRHWRLAEQVLLGSESIKEQLAGFAGTSFLSLIGRLAMRQGDPTIAWPIVRAATNPLENNYKGSNLAIWISKQQNLELGDSFIAPDREALELLYEGKVAAALKKPASDVLKERIYSRYGLWNALSKEEVRKLYLQESFGVSQQAAEAILFEYAGNFRAADELWQTLLGSEGEEQTSDFELEISNALKLLEEVDFGSRNQLILALMASGRCDAVGQYLRQTDQDAAFDFLASDGKYESVFELQGLQSDFSNFQQWLKNQKTRLQAQAMQFGRDPALDAFAQASHMCNIMVGLGYKSEAEQYFETICEVADNKQHLWDRALWLWMNRDESRQLALRVIGTHFRTLSANTRRSILKNFFPELGVSASLLAANIPVLEPEPPLFEALDHLQACDNSYFEQHGSSIEAWLRKVEKVILRDNANDPARLVLQLKDLASLAQLSNLKDYALELALTQIELKNVAPEHWNIAADIYMNRGDAARAADILAGLRSASSSSYSHSMLVKEGNALLLSGQLEKHDELARTRWMRPLALTRIRQGSFHYGNVASELFDQADFGNAEEYAKTAVQHADFGSYDVYQSCRELGQIYEEQKMYAESAEVLRIPLLESLRPRASLIEFQVASKQLHFLRYLIIRERIHRAVGCIERGEFQAAERHMKVGERSKPQDIEMVVLCYPKLVAAGQNELAQRLFDSYDSVMQKQLQRWPNDAMAANNLAWMYARCDRKLEEALKLAQKGVSLAPSSPTYLDTLAEVHYRSGRVDAAVNAMKKCVRLNPRERHYRENLERFAARRP